METVSLGRGAGSAFCVVKIVSPGTVWISSAAQRSEAKGLKAIPGSLVKASWTDSLRKASPAQRKVYRAVDRDTLTRLSQMVPRQVKTKASCAICRINFFFLRDAPWTQ